MFLRDSATGLGKTGLDHTSSGLQIAVIADNESAVTSYTSAGSTIETITVIGTYAAPTSGKVRFKAVDGTLFPGLYEIQIADARFAVSGARSIQGVVRGVTGVDPCPFEIQLDAAPADVTHLLGTAWLAPTVEGTPDINVKTITDGAITAAKIAASALDGKGDWNTVAPPTESEIWTYETRGLTEATALDSAASASLAAIQAKTDQLTFSLANQLDVSIHSVTEDGFDDIFQTYQITESYPAIGVESTPAQAFYLIQQVFSEFTINGTEISIKKLNGTEAATYTMDSASRPLSRGRTT